MRLVSTKSDLENRVLVRYEQSTALPEHGQLFAYFYDHPLDHVPGLMLWHWMENATKSVGLILEEVEAKFLRFCKLESTLDVTVVDEGLDSVLVLMHQDEALIASFVGRVRQKRLEVGRASSKITLPSSLGLTNQKYVHKFHADNVLISMPQKNAYGHMEATALSLPPHHWLNGKVEQGSLIYYCELAKQMLTFYAHSEQLIALDWSMILDDVRLVCPEPATGAGMRLEMTDLDVRSSSNRIVARCAVNFYQDDLKCAHFVVNATVISPKLLARMGRA